MIDGISAYMASLVQTSKCGATNSEYPAKLGYYVVKYVSVTFRLQDYIKKNEQVPNSDELMVKSEYLSIIKAKTNWYWKKMGINKLSFYLPEPFSIHV